MTLAQNSVSGASTQPADNLMAMIAAAVSNAIRPVQQQLLELKTEFGTSQLEQGGSDVDDSKDDSELERDTQGAPKRRRRKLTIANP